MGQTSTDKIAAYMVDY